MLKRLCVLLFLVGVGAVIAKADTVVDPRIVISEPACQEGDTDVTQLNAGFVVIPINGGGTFGFCNRLQLRLVPLSAPRIALRTHLTRRTWPSRAAFPSRARLNRMWSICHSPAPDRFRFPALTRTWAYRTSTGLLSI
jgi:hypothetical protein